ncbi:MAG: hypothetical protein ACHQ02_09435, partial [Candidatus Limnocylindrales bacterium]
QSALAGAARAAKAASPRTATHTSTSGAAAPATVNDVPRILIRLPPTATSPSAWLVTAPGDPSSRTPMVAPFVDLVLGPASADGSILATTAGQALTVRLDGSELVPVSAVPLPAGHALLPACYAGDGRALFAEAETLGLVALTDGVVEPFSAVAFTLGECAALADGRTLVAVDGGGLVAVGPAGVSAPIVGALGRHLSAAGRRLVMIDPATEFGEAIVREGTVGEDGSLGAVIGAVAGGPGGRVADARSSPDGHWLAVILERETPTGADARLRVYRIGDDGLTAVTENALEVGARITVLADP